MRKGKRQESSVEVGFGEWVRHTAYEIRNGNICPAAGAKLLRYDPWPDFNGTKDVHLKPYQTLLDLLRDIRARPSAEKKLVCDWCTKHGLLGVLPLRIASVLLMPKRIGNGEFEGLTQTKNQIVSQVQIAFTRHRRYWTRIAMPIWKDKMVAKSSSPQKRNRSYLLERPGVNILSLNHRKWGWEPLTYTWARFFPTVQSDDAEAYQYPMPGSDEFWAMYCEPIPEFMQAARFFADTVDLIRRRERIGEERLNILLDTVGPVFRGSATHVKWLEISLLSAFAAMLYQDLLGGGLIRRCPGCGVAFATTKKTKFHCSEQCQWKMTKRRQRQS